MNGQWELGGVSAQAYEAFSKEEAPPCGRGSSLRQPFKKRRRKMIRINCKVKLILFIIVLAWIIGGIFTNSSAQGPVNMKLASTRMGSGWYVMAGVMADVIKNALPAGSTVDALPKSGAIGNPKLLGSKKIELGFTFPMVANWAWNGKLRYKEKIRGIRAIAGGLDSYWVAGAVKANVDIKSWADVKAKNLGLRISSQTKGGLSDVAARQILGEYEISVDNLKAWGGDFLMKGFNEMVPGLKEGAIDGFLMMCTPNHPTWTELAIARPMKFVSLEQAIISQLSQKYGYTPSVLPAGMFQGQNEDVVTIGFPTVLLTHEDMPSEVVYTVLKSIVENKDRIKSVYKSFKAFDPKTAWKSDKLGGVPLHAGAEKFYKEKGWK
jgi:TRAP transporter TAXI family solute receptor